MALQFNQKMNRKIANGANWQYREMCNNINNNENGEMAINNNQWLISWPALCGLASWLMAVKAISMANQLA